MSFLYTTHRHMITRVTNMFYTMYIHVHTCTVHVARATHVCGYGIGICGKYKQRHRDKMQGLSHSTRSDSKLK